jgi:pyruvate/oxaloacetate carboxyltransferase
MSELDAIEKIIKKIVSYYVTLKGNDSLLDFLRVELKCINESLDLVDLSILPIDKEYISECRHTVYKALEDNNYKELTKKLHAEIVGKILKIKKYSQMSQYERLVYEAFMLLFPIEIEGSDLMIEMFTAIFLKCTENNEKTFLKILEKYFVNIIE